MNQKDKADPDLKSAAVAAQCRALLLKFGPAMTREQVAEAIGVSSKALSVMASRHGGARSFFPTRMPGGRARYATALVAAWMCGELVATPVEVLPRESKVARGVGRPRKGGQARSEA